MVMHHSGNAPHNCVEKGARGRNSFGTSHPPTSTLKKRVMWGRMFQEGHEEVRKCHWNIPF